MAEAEASARPADLDVLARLVEARSSCRAYRDAPVADALIERLLAVAARSASWCNVQPWHATLLSGEARRRMGERLLAAIDGGEAMRPDIAFPTEYAGIYGERRRESGFALYEALGVARDDKARRAAEMRRNFDFFGAPHVLILSAPTALGEYGLLDCGLFVGAFLLAVEAAGLGAISQASVALHSGLLRETLALPRERRIVCAIAFGHPHRDHRANSCRTARAPIVDVAEIVTSLPARAAAAS